MLFFAGHDTAGIKIAWAFIPLSQNPSQQKKLHQHFLSLLESYQPETKLLRNIVEESMQMFPAAAIISLHVTIKDIIVLQENGNKTFSYQKFQFHLFQFSRMSW